MPTFLQETKGYLSSSVLLPSPSRGIDSQNTLPAGLTTTVLRDTTLVESAGPTSTSSQEAASPTIASASSTPNKNIVPIIVGSILAAILGIALVIAVVTWFLRVRSRSRSEDELSWDPEPNSGHIYDGGSSFDLPSPFHVGQDRITLPVRPRPPDPAARPRQGFAEPQATQPFYPRLAAPELAHTTGPLTVTNLMPGDVPLSTNTSIFMGSRPGSTQATPRIDNSAPRFTRLHDGGLPVPWSRGPPEPIKGPSSRPKAWPSRLSATSLKNVFSLSTPKSVHTDPSQPRTSTANMRNYFKLASNSNIQLPEPAKTADQTWSATIRTGITSAFSAVMGTSARQHEPPDSNLTPIPPRPNRRLSSKTGVSTLGSLSTTSTKSVADYTMEKKSEGLPVTRAHSYGLSCETVPLDETIEEEIEEGDDTEISSLPGFSILKDAPAHTVITKQAAVAQIPRVHDDIMDRPSSVPRLPTIRPLSRAWTLRNEGLITLPESDDGYRNAFNQMVNERKEEYDRRLAELEAVAAEEASRPVMSRASTTSFMTESTALSRQSSIWDEDERKAKKVLRMRRKRAMALSASGMSGGRRKGT